LIGTFGFMDNERTQESSRSLKIVQRPSLPLERFFQLDTTDNYEKTLTENW